MHNLKFSKALFRLDSDGQTESEMDLVVSCHLVRSSQPFDLVCLIGLRLRA